MTSQVQILKIHCMLMANQKTDSELNVYLIILNLHLGVTNGPSKTDLYTKFSQISVIAILIMFCLTWSQSRLLLKD